MATLMKNPEVDSDPAEQGEASAAKWQNRRVQLTAAALLAGLSVAVPAVMMVFVRPLNGASIDIVDGEWVGGPGGCSSLAQWPSA